MSEKPKKSLECPLAGKFALVTGGSRGIGRGIVLKLAEKGASVAINYLKDESAATRTLEEFANSAPTDSLSRATYPFPRTSLALPPPPKKSSAAWMFS